MIRGLDHVALVVRDTERALLFWRDALGLEVRFSELARGGTVRLTNLALGATELQLVEPLDPEHPLLAGLGERESALHHLGLCVDEVVAARDQAQELGLAGPEATIIPATLGRTALFLDEARTQGIVLELLPAAPE
jgi:methylmalonyl-CoA/ethylmalonyl-CoA epimerase